MVWIVKDRPGQSQTRNTEVYLLRSLDQSTPLQFRNHLDNKVGVELHFIHLHLSGLQTNTWSRSTFHSSHDEYRLSHCFMQTKTFKGPLFYCLESILYTNYVVYQLLWRPVAATAALGSSDSRYVAILPWWAADILELLPWRGTSTCCAWAASCYHQLVADELLFSTKS